MKPYKLVDVLNRLKETPPKQFFAAAFAVVTLVLATCATTALAAGPAPAATPGPPPSSVGVFPLALVHRGQMGVAWTVFEGTAPEPMDVEILGILRGARGPGQDMILARLHGAKAEYTGVVAGMSGSPVYIDGKLLGALSYRIGQFSKEAIAGITPIEDMLEVRDLPPPASLTSATPQSSGETTFTAMETPLLMSGFAPEAIRLWKDRMAGTGLETVSAGGPLGNAESSTTFPDNYPVVPGSAVSLQLVRGDMEIAATCTVTYVDPTQLLACGHPILQAGPVSLPMTTAEVLATLASPLNAFKIINTGREIGAFTEDRASAIRGQLGAHAHMIPVSIDVQPASGKPSQRNVEILDLPQLTPSAVLVTIYQILLETNRSSAGSSYHVTGQIALAGQGNAQLPISIDSWGTPSDTMAAQLEAAFSVGEAFNRLYDNASRLQPIQSIHLRIEQTDQDLRAEIEAVRLISSGIVHAGDTVAVEATIRPWHQPARNIRLPFTIPARLEPGNMRIFVSSSASLDRTLEATRPQGRQATFDAASARLRGLHPADRIFVSLLLPESQASLEGQVLQSLPLSMVNTMEPQRSGSDVGLHGESLQVVAQAPAGGVLTGQQILNLRIEAGGGLH